MIDVSAGAWLGFARTHARRPGGVAFLPQGAAEAAGPAGYM